MRGGSCVPEMADYRSKSRSTCIRVRGDLPAPIRRGSSFHHALGIGVGPVAAFIHQRLWNPAVAVPSTDLHWPGSFCFLPLETLTAAVLPGDLATRLGEVQVTRRGSCRSVAQLSHGRGGPCEWTSEDVQPSKSGGSCSSS